MKVYKVRFRTLSFRACVRDAGNSNTTIIAFRIPHSACEMLTIYKVRNLTLSFQTLEVIPAARSLPD